MLQKIFGTEINSLREYLNKLWKYKYRNHMQNTLKMDYLNYSFLICPKTVFPRHLYPSSIKQGFWHLGMAQKSMIKLCFSIFIFKHFFQQFYQKIPTFRLISFLVILK